MKQLFDTFNNEYRKRNLNDLNNWTKALWSQVGNRDVRYGNFDMF